MGRGEPPAPGPVSTGRREMSESTEKPISIESMMQKALAEPGMLSLAAGFTDSAFMPRDEIAALVGDLLSLPEAGGEALQYGDPPGREGLRRRVAERVGRLEAEAGGEPGAIRPEQVLITNGSQQGLELAVRALCRPGDAVLVESPTYFVFLDLLRELGVEPVALPARDDRLDADPGRLERFFAELERDGRAERIRAAYVMGYFANPTGYSLPAGARRRLLSALDDAGLSVPVIEDAAYREFHFGAAPETPSVLSLERPGRPVLYAGTFTKTFATGLKAGYLVVRHPGLRERIGGLKRVSDFGTSNFVQALLERALDRGVYDRFLRRMRAHYARKADALHRALTEAGMDELGWRWKEARGGLYLWLTAPAGVPVGPGSEFYEACMAEKVMYVPGSLCYCGPGGEGKARLSYGNLDRERLQEAARRLARAARDCARTGAAA